MSNVLLGIILDESGSMQPNQEQTISAYNEFLSDVKRQKGKRTAVLTKFSGGSWSLESFSDPAPTVRMSATKPVSRLTKLTKATYKPGGNTPLYDAVGDTIARLDAELDELGVCLTCGHGTDEWVVLVMITTDGMENASRRFNAWQIKNLIQERERRGWKFVYGGVDQDKFTAERQATTMGMSAGSTYSLNRMQGMGSRSETVAMAAMNPAARSAELAAYTQKLYDAQEKESK